MHVPVMRACARPHAPARCERPYSPNDCGAGIDIIIIGGPGAGGGITPPTQAPGNGIGVVPGTGAPPATMVIGGIAPMSMVGGMAPGPDIGGGSGVPRSGMPTGGGMPAVLKGGKPAPIGAGAVGAPNCAAMLGTPPPIGAGAGAACAEGVGRPRATPATASWGGSGARPPGGGGAVAASEPPPLGEAPPFFSAKTSPKGSGPLEGPLFSILSRSSRVRPGFKRLPVVSPNIVVPMPTPFVIHAGLLSRWAPA
mmetsp:Transcript_23968/g.69318  ORF Transcript_23968/g.69318 Transcript_23968/m.69318 type:complete len:253 (-) Transcript_23968:709-1467(-)